MSSKTMALLKALLFFILTIILIGVQFSDMSKLWPLVGIIICVILVIGYLKQAFNK